MRRRPKTAVLEEGSRRRFGSEFHVDGPVTANADRHMSSADVAALSVDGWKPNADAVVMQSQRLVTSVPPDTVEQCRPGIGASSYTQFVLDALRYVEPMKVGV